MVKELKVDKKMVVRQVRNCMTDWYERYKKAVERDGNVELVGGIDGYCLWWAFMTCGVLNAYGVEAQLQAGSAFWRRVPMRIDDQYEEAPDFGYLYTPGPHNLQAVVRGGLPEIHCWAAVPDHEATAESGEQQGWLIDLTSRFFPQRAKALGGYDWPGEVPPETLWCHTSEKPPNCQYVSYREAIDLCMGIILHTNPRNFRINVKQLISDLAEVTGG